MFATVNNVSQKKPYVYLMAKPKSTHVFSLVVVLSHLVGSSWRPYALLRSLIFNETSWCLSILPYLTGLHLDLNFHDDINVLEHRVVIANIYYLFCGACRRRGTQPATVDPG